MITQRNSDLRYKKITSVRINIELIIPELGNLSS